MSGDGDFEWLVERPLLAAPKLLGAILQVGERAGRIVEVEAYEGDDDPASHANRGPTDRNRVMFGKPGRLYVYRIYGMHWCANIVCGPPGEPGAVLVRAIEPVAGIDRMWVDRPKASQAADLGSGPGKLCAALGISGADGGTDLLAGRRVRLVPPSVDAAHGGGASSVVSGPRIGITKAADRPWRFAVAGNPHVSRPRPAGWASAVPRLSR